MLEVSRCASFRDRARPLARRSKPARGNPTLRLPVRGQGLFLPIVVVAALKVGREVRVIVAILTVVPVDPDERDLPVRAILAVAEQMSPPVLSERVRHRRRGDAELRRQEGAVLGRLQCSMFVLLCDLGLRLSFFWLFLIGYRTFGLALHALGQELTDNFLNVASELYGMYNILTNRRPFCCGTTTHL